MQRLWPFMCLIAVVTAIETRVALDTWRGHQEYLYRPFVLRAGTNEIVWHHFVEDLRVGDRLLALEGRPFTGMAQLEQWRVATYSRWNWEPYIVPSNPYNQYPDVPWVTVRRADGRVQDVETGHAHCTCGAFGPREVALYLILPRLFCLAVGMLGAAALLALPESRRNAGVVFAVCLSLAMLSLDFAWTDAFTQAADVRQWPEAWMRVPALVIRTFFGASWAGWLAVMTGGRWRWWFATPVFTLATVASLCEVGWSENYKVLGFYWSVPRVLSFWVPALLGGYALWRRTARSVMVAVCGLPFALFPLAPEYWFRLPTLWVVLVPQCLAAVVVLGWGLYVVREPG